LALEASITRGEVARVAARARPITWSCLTPSTTATAATAAAAAETAEISLALIVAAAAAATTVVAATISAGYVALEARITRGEVACVAASARPITWSCLTPSATAAAAAAETAEISLALGGASTAAAGSPLGLEAGTTLGRTLKLGHLQQCNRQEIKKEARRKDQREGRALNDYEPPQKWPSM
jgi:hypothetical protein